MYTFVIGYRDGVVRRRIAAVVDSAEETVHLDPGCCYGCSHVFGPREYWTLLSEARAQYRASIEADLKSASNRVRYLKKRLKTVDTEKVRAAYVHSKPQPQPPFWYLPD